MARLAADDMAGGSHCADVSADWSLTWHATCACWHHNYIMLMPSLACLLCMLTSQLCHADVINIRVSHMGRVNWYSGRVSPSGRRRRVARVGRVCARGQTPLPESDGECGHVRRPILTPFSPVASSRPPLHSGIVKTPFWELSFLSKNQTPF